MRKLDFQRETVSAALPSMNLIYCSDAYDNPRREIRVSTRRESLCGRIPAKTRKHRMNFDSRGKLLTVNQSNLPIESPGTHFIPVPVTSKDIEITVQKHKCYLDVVK